MKIGKKHRGIKVILTCRNTIVFLFRKGNCPLVLQESNGIFLFPLFLPSRSGLHEAATFNFRYGPINTELQNICSPNLHLFFSEFLFYYGNNVINHPFEPIFITALSHDADERFRA